MKKNVPDWVKPENARWANCQWEPMSHLRRLGAQASKFFGNVSWIEKWYGRMFSKEGAGLLAEHDINIVATNFYKGFGLAFEKEEMSRQKEFVKYCHELGIKVVGYVGMLSLYYETFLEEEPDLMSRVIRDRDGKAKPLHPGLYYRLMACLNHRESIEYLKKVMDYGYKETGLDGFHLDWNMFPPCYCDACTGLFREYLAKNIKTKERMGFDNFKHVKQPPFTPPDPAYQPIALASSKIPAIRDPLTQEWVRFRTQRFSRIQKEIYNHVKNLNPQLAIFGGGGIEYIDNWAVQSAVDHREYCKSVDVCFFETDYFPRRIKDNGIISQNTIFKLAEAFDTYSVPTTWIINENDEAVLPLTGEEISLALFETAALGGIPASTWGMRTLGKDKVVFDIEDVSTKFKSIIHFINEHSNCFAGAETFAEVAILYSFESLNFAGADATRSLTSMQHILFRNNISYKIITEHKIKDIRNFNLIIIPDAVCLSKKMADKIIDFVNSGGKAIITGRSGNCNENFIHNDKNFFEDILVSENVAFWPDAPEKEVEANKNWPHHVHRLGKNSAKIISTIKKILGKDSLIEIEAPDGVFVESRILPDRRIVIHLLNYNKFLIPSVTLRLPQKMFAGMKFVDFSLDKDLTVDQSGQNIEIKNLKTHAMLASKRK